MTGVQTCALPISAPAPAPAAAAPVPAAAAAAPTTAPAQEQASEAAQPQEADAREVNTEDGAADDAERAKAHIITIKRLVKELHQSQKERESAGLGWTDDEDDEGDVVDLEEYDVFPQLFDRLGLTPSSCSPAEVEAKFALLMESEAANDDNARKQIAWAYYSLRSTKLMGNYHLTVSKMFAEVEAAKEAYTDAFKALRKSDSLFARLNFDIDDLTVIMQLVDVTIKTFEEVVARPCLLPPAVKDVYEHACVLEALAKAPNAYGCSSSEGGALFQAVAAASDGFARAKAALRAIINGSSCGAIATLVSHGRLMGYSDNEVAKAGEPLAKFVQKVVDGTSSDVLALVRARGGASAEGLLDELREAYQTTTTHHLKPFHDVCFNAKKLNRILRKGVRRDVEAHDVAYHACETALKEHIVDAQEEEINWVNPAPDFVWDDPLHKTYFEHDLFFVKQFKKECEYAVPPKTLRLYEMLGLPSISSDDRVLSAIRKKLLICAADKGAGCETNKLLFNKLNDAKELMQTLRPVYDDLGDFLFYKWFQEYRPDKSVIMAESTFIDDVFSL